MRVNGSETSLDVACTLKSYIEREGYDINRIAVEKNGEIIRKALYETVILNNSDHLEIVMFVGGG